MDDRQYKKSSKGRYKVKIYGHRKIVHDKVLEKSDECTKQIFEAKKNYILNMTKTFADSNAFPKMY